MKYNFTAFIKDPTDQQNRKFSYWHF